MKAYTSRVRFDETRNFTGVYQQMGRVSVDADWNEEVLIRTTDARRRTSDLAHGSPDDGFAISDEHVVDRITSAALWTGGGLAPGDLRVIPPQLRLDRREPEGLPYVVRSHGHIHLERRFDAPVDLTAIPLWPDGAFAAAALVFSVRFERPANDDEPTDVRFFVEDAGGNRADVAASFGADLPEAWHHQRVAVAAFAGVDATRIAAWGVIGLSPRSTTWVDALRATDAALAPLGGDFVVRGGDGTVTGAGRMLVDGLRAYRPRDVRYSRQPDLPEPPALAPLQADGSDAHIVYLDAWEEVVTALDDPFLREPALDGLDTTVRLRLLTQIKVLQGRDPKAAVALPAATGGGRLTTNVPSGALPDRYPVDPTDPCRDRCLFTESASLGDGYTGAHNLHLRIEVLFTDGPRPVFVWSRDNGSTRLPLLADAPADATTLAVSGEDALRLRAGDVVVISNRRIDRQPEGARRPVLRVVKSCDPASGTVMLREGGFELSTDPASLVVGGPLGADFSVADQSYLRRWDGADWLLDDVRYNLPEGIAVRFAGSGFRPGEYWSFTARIENADGAARGVVEQLTDAPAHGPVHHYVPLARITRDGDALHYEDLRPRFLPLGEVRSRLAELAAASDAHSAFTLVVGDGVRTFGDIDQDLVEGVTGDEALQSAVNTLRNAGGGTLYVRAGDYRLEKPVLLSGCSRLRVLGDGDASQLRVVGAGGAFIVDGCGDDGELGIELLSLVEAPLEDSVIGADAEELPPPGEDVEPLDPDDLVRTAAPAPSFAETVAASMIAPGRFAHRPLNAVRAALDALRRLQRANPGQPVEDLPEAAPLLAALRQIPHGVVTVGDSRRVTLHRLRIESREPNPEAAGVFITGTCAELAITECRIEAASGVAAVPYAPYLARGFLAHNVRSDLALDGVRVSGNTVRPRGSAAHGIHLADGRLRRIDVTDNDVAGFAIGIAVRDRVDVAAEPSRVVVAGNRVTGCTGLGLDIVGRGVDVVDAAVNSGPPAGLVQMGIRVRGADIRVRDCDVALPAGAGAAASPLGAIAAIVVGGGVDAGADTGEPYRGYAAVHGVEIAGCRVRGGGAAYPGIGVLIGGPEPVLDVRVRDCDIDELGDAAVRVWGHGGKVGRVRVDDNRVDSVALADVPRRADVRPALETLAPSVAAALVSAGVDLGDPRAVLAALITSVERGSVAPLDAVLRWISLRTLRGAVVFDQVFDGEVTGNRIDGVGRDGAAAGDDVRTAGIAVIGGVDVAVEHNRVADVAADVAGDESPPGAPPPRLPSAFATLADLELAADDGRPGRDDVHLAATALRRMVLAYGAGDDAERQQIGRRVYASMDALVGDLDAFGGAGSKIAAALALEADEMRTAQGRDDHTRASNRVRASLSRAAAFTADGDQASEAWDAATQLDLAIVAGAPGPAATRLQDAAAELTEGLPERRAALEPALGAVVQAPDDLAAQLAAAGELGTLGEWRDATARQGGAVTPAQLLGAKRTIVTRFAERLAAESDRLSIDADVENRAVLDALHGDKQALVESLRDTNDDLARALEVDWQSVERSVTAPRKQRLQATLARATAWAQGQDAPSAATADEVSRLDDSGAAALTVLVARHLDDNVARLSVEPEGMKTKSLRVLRTAAGQLRNLVDADPGAAELATKANAAIAAAAADPQARTAQLATARTMLDAIRRRAQLLVPPPRKAPPLIRPAHGVHLQLAALGAAALTLRTAAGSALADGVAAYRAHFGRALDGARVTGSVHATAVAAVSAALDALARDAGASTRGHAVHTLIRELDRVLAGLPGHLRASGVDAVVALVHAALLGVATGDDGATRLLRAQAYLRDHSAALSQSVHLDLARRSAIDDLLEGLRAVLERLSRGERPFVPELPPPSFQRRLAPADGVFAAGPVGRLRIAGNQLQQAVRGITLVGDDGHPLVGSARGGDGIVVTIAGNLVDGCALGGLDLHPTGDVALGVTDNDVFACAGVGEPGPAGIGQAVVLVRGHGNLVIAGNSLHGNGHDHARALVHELVVDWRGEAVVRGNTVRHAGGGAGGAGVLIVAESADSSLPAKLATAPFLGIEPPPSRSRLPAPVPGPPIFQPLPALTHLVKGLAPLAAISAERVTTGRLVQTMSTTRIAPRAITVALEPRPTGLAAATAARYLDRTARSPLRAILDFVRPWQYWRPLPLPPPPEQRTFHVEGNDIAARGPALLLVADERGDLISLSAVGNGLHSEGSTGAAYLRYAENLVFTGNRCQAADAVNVVVIRALDSAVSVTGNTVVGREPVAPPKPPRPPTVPRPHLLGPATLNLSLGKDAHISVPVDATKLRGNLEAFSSAARQAFASVLLERATAEEPYLAPLELREVTATPPAPAPPDESVAPSPAVAGAPRFMRIVTRARPSVAAMAAARPSFGAILEEARAPFAISPFTEPQEPAAVLGYIKNNKLGSRDVEALLRGTDLQAFESDDSRARFMAEVDEYRKSKKLDELAAAKPVESAIARADASRVFDRVATKTDTQAGAVAEMTRLFTSQGFEPARTSAEVHALLDKSDGDALAALGTLKRDILATDASSLAARKVFDNAGLLEKILADGLIAGGDAIAEPDRDEPDEADAQLAATARAAPDPHDHSLVILGGATVAAVGNATTAGTLVVDAAETVELNA